MTTKQLRNKILDLAIKGKLVEKEGEWEEKMLGEVCKIKGGKRIPKGKSFSDEPTNHAYIRVTNMKNHTIVSNDIKYIDDSVYELIKNYTISSSDLYLTIAGTIGDVGEVPEEFDMMNLTENAAKLTDITCDKKYLMYCLLSNPSQDHFSSKFHQVAQPKLSIETAKTTLIPLPPLAEQHRIVAAVEQWMSLIDIIESGKENLQQSIALAKNKILDLAIKGKLVEKEGVWEEKMLKEVCKIVMGQSPSGDSLKNNVGVEFHQGKLSFGEMYLEESGIFTSEGNKYAEPDSVVLCVRAPVGIPNITKRKICIGRGLCALHCEDNIDLHFLYYALLTQKTYFEENATGSTFKSISGDIIKKATLPLPPLSEQHRIVAKIEELFTQLDIIANALK